jgi:hypothetical protein
MNNEIHRAIAQLIVQSVSLGATPQDIEQQILVSLDGVRDSERAFWQSAIKQAAERLQGDEWALTRKVLRAILESAQEAAR